MADIDRSRLKSIWELCVIHETVKISHTRGGILCGLDQGNDKKRSPVSRIEKMLQDSPFFADALIEKVVDEIHALHVNPEKDFGRVTIARNIWGISFNKCVLRAKSHYPDIFKNFLATLNDYGLDTLLGLGQDDDAAGDNFILTTILLHHMCSSPRWGRAFSDLDVATSYLDNTELCNVYRGVDIHGFPLGTLAAWYGIPITNIRVLALPSKLYEAPYFTVPFKRNPPSLPKTESIAAAYLTIFDPETSLAEGDSPLLPLTSREKGYDSVGTARVQARGQGLKDFLIPEKKIALGTALARLMSDPMFLVLPSKVEMAPDKNIPIPFIYRFWDVPIAENLFRILDKHIGNVLHFWDNLETNITDIAEGETTKKYSRIASSLKKKTLSSFLNPDANEFDMLVDKMPFDTNRSLGMKALMNLCRNIWSKKTWLAQRVPFQNGTTVCEVPVFKLHFSLSPLIPAMLSPKEWETYMSLNGGNFLITRKKWDNQSAYPQYSWCSRCKDLVKQRFRLKDYFIQDEMSKEFFYQSHAEETASSITINDFQRLKEICDDKALISLLEVNFGRLGHRLELPEAYPTWRERHKSPLQEVIERLQKSPPNISRLKGKKGQFTDLRESDLAAGLTYKWFKPYNATKGDMLPPPDLPESSVRISNDTYEFMTAPILSVDKGPSRTIEISTFDLFLGRLSLFTKMIVYNYEKYLAYNEYSNFNILPLKDLIRSDRYWDLPVDKVLHGDPLVRRSARDKRYLDISYCVFDRMLEILMDIAFELGKVYRISEPRNSDVMQLMSELKDLGHLLFIQSAPKGEKYLKTIAGTLYSTTSRKRAARLAYPRLEESLMVHLGIRGGYHKDSLDIDVFDDYLDKSIGLEL